MIWQLCAQKEWLENAMSNQNIKGYEDKKKTFYESMKKYAAKDVCLAFSGGTDSSLLLKAAVSCAKEGIRIYAVTFDTVLHPPADLEIAKKVAGETQKQEAKVEIIHKVIHVNELENEKIKYNPVDRCYICKHMLFEKLKAYAKEQGAEIVLEGTNGDDLLVYRPGIRAVKELGIISPLAEAGFTKEEVRRLAGDLGISVASRPATPCLATRLPYGTEIKPEVLQKIGEGEAYIRENGFPIVRLRLHGEILRVELPKEDFERFLKEQEGITAYLKKLGFKYITLDIEGFRSGSMDLYLLD